MAAVDRRVLALAVARMADAVGNAFLIVVLPLYIGSGVIGGDAFGLDEAMVIGVTLGLFGFVNSAAQPFAGRLSDRAGARKRFILAGLALLAATNVAYAFADTYVHVLAIRALQGVGVALTIPVTLALVSELSDADDRGGNMGVFNTFRLLGFGAGPLVAGAVVAGGPYAVPTPWGALTMSGFDGAFAFATLTALAGYGLVALLVNDPDELGASAGADLSLRVLDRHGPRVLDPVFALGLTTLFMAAAIGLFSAIEIQVNHRLGQGPMWFGLQFSAFMLPQVLFQVPVGRASDRYGRYPFILAGMALLAPATLAQGFATTPVEMLAARLVQGVAGALVFAPALAMGGDLARTGESGSSLSVLTMGFGLGIAIGPVASGYLIRHGFLAPFAFGATLALVGALVVHSQVDETHRPRQAGAGTGAGSGAEAGAGAGADVDIDVDVDAPGAPAPPAPK